MLELSGLGWYAYEVGIGVGELSCGREQRCEKLEEFVALQSRRGTCGRLQANIHVQEDYSHAALCSDMRERILVRGT